MSCLAALRTSLSCFSRCRWPDIGMAGLSLRKLLDDLTSTSALCPCAIRWKEGAWGKVGRLTFRPHDRHQSIASSPSARSRAALKAASWRLCVLHSVAGSAVVVSPSSDRQHGERDLSTSRRYSHFLACGTVDATVLWTMITAQGCLQVCPVFY